MIPPPLWHLIKACETICVAECCGLDAFDFSPIHIASYLIRSSGDIHEPDVVAIRAAIVEWRQQFGSASGKGYTSDAGEMNANLSPRDVDGLSTELELNLGIALEVIRSVQLRILPHVPAENANQSPAKS